MLCTHGFSRYRFNDIPGLRENPRAWGPEFRESEPSSPPALLWPAADTQERFLMLSVALTFPGEK